MSSEIEHSMQQVLAHLVEHVPGVVGARVSSADGFALASHLPGDGHAGEFGNGDGQGEGDSVDAAGLGAMAAAALALSNRLLATVGDAPAAVTHHRSTDGQVLVMPIAHLAALTVLATADADANQLTAVAVEATSGLQRLFRGVASV